METPSVDWQQIVGIVVAGLSAIVATYGLIGAFRSGALKGLRFGSFEIVGQPHDISKIKEEIAGALKKNEAVPFEIEQLANYYSQILSQSKVSFWFSLIFASLGFLVIVLAAFLYSNLQSGATIAQFIAGVIMDAVAGLFFVQSRNAQKSMGEFFDKLRSDRNQVESRNLCDSISSDSIRDALKVRLSLYYAGVDGDIENAAKTIIDANTSESTNGTIESPSSSKSSA